MEARDFVEIVEAHNLDAADTEACVIASVAEPKHISVVVAGLRIHFPEADAVRLCASFEDAPATVRLARQSLCYIAFAPMPSHPDCRFLT